VIRRFVSGLALMWLIGLIAFTLTLPKAADDQRTQGVIVLTGGQGRIERGLDILERQRADRLLISGVHPGVALSAITETYHVPVDLAACCIDIGYQANDTRANAIEAEDWINRHHYHLIRIITNNWHMRRAMLEVRRVVPANVTLIADAVEVSPPLSTIVIEYNKYIWRLVSIGIR